MNKNVASVDPEINYSTYCLNHALDAAQKQYTSKNPKSRNAFETAKNALPGANTRSVLFYSPFPVTLKRAQGALIEDIDGHTYQDFLGEYTAGLYGHSHPKIMGAISDALKKGLTLGGPTSSEAQYAALICERFPAIERMRFCNSGTEANILALSSARAFTNRTDILVIDGSYHGGVLSFAGESPLNIPYPTHRVQFNNCEQAASKIKTIGSKLAAVIIEPMIGAGGCIPGQSEFLMTVREETSKTGALLIFDEVMTSRHGATGLHGRLGIRPDIVTLGKYLGGGLSFGAFGGRADIIDRFDPTKTNAWSHAGTFNNNILSMTAGFTGLNEVFTTKIADSFFKQGEQFRQGLKSRLNRLDLPIHLTGMGSMMALHFSSAVPTSPYSPTPAQHKIYELIHLEMMQLGQFYARRGMINLSLPVTAEMCEEFCAALIKTLERFRSEITGALKI
jgi:glutamate-1-semialdehyde 2,1-aminomutase